MECKAAGGSVFVREVLFEGNCEQAVDTDITLPDYCPDIGKLLKCRMTPMITLRQVNFDSLVVEGTARLSVIYLDDREKKIRCCDRDLPFRASLPYDNSTENVTLLADAKVDYVNCRVVSQRRLDIHGAFTIHMTALCRKENELISDAQGEGLRVRRETREISDLACCAGVCFDISEAIELSEGKAPISSIIRSGAVLCPEEIRPMAGKLVVKGDAVFTMVYCTEQDADPEHLEYVIPFSQFIDLPGADEDCVPDVILRCDAVEVSPRTDSDGEYRRVDVEIRAGADVKLYRDTTACWVSDVYSVSYEVACASRQLKMEKLCDSFSETSLQKQSVDVGDVRIQSVCDLWTNVTDSRSVWRDGKVTVTGNLAVCMMLRDSSKGIVYCEKNVRFECGVSRGGCGQNVRPECRVAVKSCGYTLTGENKLELQAELCLHGSLYEEFTARGICSVEVDENRPKSPENRPAAVLCFAEAGEELWDIAREYNSSVESIKADNGIDSDTVEESRLLIVTA
jgi:LysM domain.